MKFANKTAVITGACGNLGHAIAETLGGEGARLVLVGSSRESLDEVFAETAPDAIKVAVDLRNLAAVKEAMGKVAADTGGIDIVCTTAGGFDMGPAVHVTQAEKWDQMMELNAGTMLNTVRAIVPGMVERGSGKIVTIGAKSALHGVSGMGAYTASKSVVHRATEAMSGELRDKGINVNCVMPSIIDTPQNRASMPKADHSKWATPAEISKVVSFLCSDDAKAVHGALIPVVGLS
ncbi:MAG: SDR family NAD(P)-dependent oxidoreductase [Pseudomonadota bacterium]